MPNHWVQTEGWEADRQLSVQSKLAQPLDLRRALAQRTRDFALSARGAASQHSINVAIGTECKCCSELDISNSRLMVLS